MFCRLILFLLLNSDDNIFLLLVCNLFLRISIYLVEVYSWELSFVWSVWFVWATNGWDGSGRNPEKEDWISLIRGAIIIILPQLVPKKSQFNIHQHSRLIKNIQYYIFFCPIVFAYIDTEKYIYIIPKNIQSEELVYQSKLDFCA